jgi:hypothetical protein
MARMRGGNLGVSRGFSNAVNKWTKATIERSEEAFQIGSLDFFLALRDATPVDTGLLRASLTPGVNGAVAAGPPNLNDTKSGDMAALNVFSKLKLGDKCTMVYKTTYAMRVNYGFTGMDSMGRYYNQIGRFWVEAVSARYTIIMRAAATRLRGNK